jgi:alpha-L-fucosidase
LKRSEGSITVSFIVRRLDSVPHAEWFARAGLGMFVHWDHASRQGIDISWPMLGESGSQFFPDRYTDLSVAEYLSSAPGFDPERWDPRELARLARRNHVSYVVFTARHAAGYAMYDSAVSDFGVMHSAAGRDLLRELVEALRAEGVRVGIYYSLADWRHPDYPAYRDEDRPYRREKWPEAGEPRFAGQPVATDRHPRSSVSEWKRYRQYVLAQLTELLTNYGRIDLIWFDAEWERSPEEWGVDEIESVVRGLQPSIVINDRLPGRGDYRTPERGLPTEPLPGAWELCMTIGDSWGFDRLDTRAKSALQLLETLIIAASRGGNLLLNTGPRGDGSLVESHVERFEALGRWLDVHGDAIRTDLVVEGVDFFGPVTARGRTLYAHLIARPQETVRIGNVPIDRVARVFLMNGGTELAYEASVDIHADVAGGQERFGTLLIEAPAASAALVDVVAVEFDRDLTGWS